jgi:16S rRNA (guanine527-N7)-methyltransferase
VRSVVDAARLAPEFRQRVSDRAARAGASLDDAQLLQFERYWHVLQRWNRTINLTGLPLEGFPSATIDRLLIEPLVAARLIEVGSPLTLVDLGSGNGSPAVPLKILRPLTRLLMVESKERKAAFLRQLARELGLEDVSVLNSRFEQLPVTMSRVADVVSVRAVRLDSALWATADFLLKKRGQLFLFGRTGDKSPTTELAPLFSELKSEALPGTESQLVVYVRC